MVQVSIRKYATSVIGGALRQGEFLSNVVQFTAYQSAVSGRSTSFNRIKYGLAIIVTLDCDLEWDFKAQDNSATTLKRLPKILLCRIRSASDLARRIKNDEQSIGKFEKSTTWNKIVQNKDERYHFLEQIEGTLDRAGGGFPSMGVDFKEVFAVPARDLYASVDEGLTQRHCRLVSPYKEHFNSRFAYFLGRIGLPSEHLYEKGAIRQLNNSVASTDKLLGEIENGA